MLTFHDIEQNSEEWFNMRAGKVTSSKLGIVMANFGKSFGEPAKKYAVDIAVEQITGQPVSDDYTNPHMQRGHEQEPIARALYENEMFCTVKNGGFFCSDTVGCSPDGIVENGLIEIKSVIPSVHYANIKRQNIDPSYKWQCLGNMKFTDKEWIEFISFCDKFPEGKKLFIYRCVKERYQDEYKMIDERLDQFLGYVETVKKRILESEYVL